MSKKIEDGGPAFPYEEHNGDGTLYRDHFGMMLRDYFAAKAMAGFCANPAHAMLDGPDQFAESAKEAYAIADALIAERAK